ncbi:MAG: hypothetical protein ACHREM_00010 [Polyangiales bacterium]
MSATKKKPKKKPATKDKARAKKRPLHIAPPMGRTDGRSIAASIPDQTRVVDIDMKSLATGAMLYVANEAAYYVWQLGKSIADVWPLNAFTDTGKTGVWTFLESTEKPLVAGAWGLYAQSGGKEFSRGFFHTPEPATNVKEQPDGTWAWSTVNLAAPQLSGIEPSRDTAMRRADEALTTRCVWHDRSYPYSAEPWTALPVTDSRAQVRVYTHLKHLRKADAMSNATWRVYVAAHVREFTDGRCGWAVRDVEGRLIDYGTTHLLTQAMQLAEEAIARVGVTLKGQTYAGSRKLEPSEIPADVEPWTVFDNDGRWRREFVLSKKDLRAAVVYPESSLGRWGYVVSNSDGSTSNSGMRATRDEAMHAAHELLTAYGLRHDGKLPAAEVDVGPWIAGEAADSWRREYAPSKGAQFAALVYRKENTGVWHYAVSSGDGSATRHGSEATRDEAMRMAHDRLTEFRLRHDNKLPDADDATSKAPEHKEVVGAWTSFPGACGAAPTWCRFWARGTINHAAQVGYNEKSELWHWQARLASNGPMASGVKATRDEAMEVADTVLRDHQVAHDNWRPDDPPKDQAETTTALRARLLRWVLTRLERRNGSDRTSDFQLLSVGNVGTTAFTPIELGIWHQRYESRAAELVVTALLDQALAQTNNNPASSLDFEVRARRNKGLTVFGSTTFSSTSLQEITRSNEMPATMSDVPLPTTAGAGPCARPWTADATDPNDWYRWYGANHVPSWGSHYIAASVSPGHDARWYWCAIDGTKMRHVAGVAASRAAAMNAADEALRRFKVILYGAIPLPEPRPAQILDQRTAIERWVRAKLVSPSLYPRVREFVLRCRMKGQNDRVVAVEMAPTQMGENFDRAAIRIAGDLLDAALRFGDGLFGGTSAMFSFDILAYRSDHEEPFACAAFSIQAINRFKPTNGDFDGDVGPTLLERAKIYARQVGGVFMFPIQPSSVVATPETTPRTERFGIAVFQNRKHDADKQPHGKLVAWLKVVLAAARNDGAEILLKAFTAELPSIGISVQKPPPRFDDLDAGARMIIDDLLESAAHFVAANNDCYFHVFANHRGQVVPFAEEAFVLPTQTGPKAIRFRQWGTPRLGGVTSWVDVHDALPTKSERAWASRPDIWAARVYHVAHESRWVWAVNFPTTQRNGDASTREAAMRRADEVLRDGGATHGAPTTEDRQPTAAAPEAAAAPDQTPVTLTRSFHAKGWRYVASDSAAIPGAAWMRHLYHVEGDELGCAHVARKRSDLVDWHVQNPITGQRAEGHAKTVLDAAKAANAALLTLDIGHDGLLPGQPA